MATMVGKIARLRIIQEVHPESPLWGACWSDEIP